MSITTELRKQLINRINALSSVQSVYGYEELNPSGWPAVWVVPSDIDGIFATTAENQRTFSYSVSCLFPIGEDFIKDNSIQRVEYADDTLATVVDQIIDDLDDNFLQQINKGIALFGQERFIQIMKQLHLRNL